MKAYVNALYGPPIRPKPAGNRPCPYLVQIEVLVKVKASSVNPADTHMMRGTPIVARASFGWSAPNYKILGHDFAGIVQEVGEKVKKFKAGDEVYGEVEQGSLRPVPH
jgi:NADPH:quinone reductase-like Zn-dependent oxidoreductase